MPAKEHKLSSGMYSVSTPNATHAKSTTKAKADAQVRLLNAIDHGFVPTGKKAKKSSDPYREDNQRYGYTRKNKRRKVSGTGIPA